MPGPASSGGGKGQKARESKAKGIDKKTAKQPQKEVRPKVAAMQAKKEAKKEAKSLVEKVRSVFDNNRDARQNEKKNDRVMKDARGMKGDW